MLAVCGIFCDDKGQVYFSLRNFLGIYACNANKVQLAIAIALGPEDTFSISYLLRILSSPISEEIRPKVRIHCGIPVLLFWAYCRNLVNNFAPPSENPLHPHRTQQSPQNPRSDPRRGLYEPL